MLAGPKHIGKESNKLEERMREELEGEESFLNVYDGRKCRCGCNHRVTGVGHKNLGSGP
jgi:hypothetical protein